MNDDADISGEKLSRLYFGTSPTDAEKELRDEFEGWMASGNYPEIADIALAKDKDGLYESIRTFAAWEAWKACDRVRRASLSSVGEGRVSEEMVERAIDGFCKPTMDDVGLPKYIITKERTRNALRAALSKPLDAEKKS